MRYFFFNFRYMYSAFGGPQTGMGSIWMQSKQFPNKETIRREASERVLQPLRDWVEKNPNPDPRQQTAVPDIAEITLMGWQEFRDQKDYMNFIKDVAPTSKAH